MDVDCRALGHRHTGTGKRKLRVHNCYNIGPDGTYTNIHVGERDERGQGVGALAFCTSLMAAL